MTSYEDPTIPMPEVELLIIGCKKKMSKSLKHWKITLTDVYIQLNNKEYIFPICKLLIDPTFLIPLDNFDEINAINNIDNLYNLKLQKYMN